MSDATLSTIPGTASARASAVPVAFDLDPKAPAAVYTPVNGNQALVAIPIITKVPLAGQATNNDTTGNIRVGIWLTSTPYSPDPTNGSDLTGYEIATVPYDALLGNNQGFTAKGLQTTTTVPPDGTYYATYALEEQNSSGQYVMEHSDSLSAPVIVKGGQFVTNFDVLDTTTNAQIPSEGSAYTGPVANLQFQYLNTTTDGLNVTANVDNVFMHSGSGQDALQAHGGTNVLDGGTGSNFLVGTTDGTDTFFVDDRGAPADIWSTVVHFHVGDAATVYGVTPQDFGLNWYDNQGATGYTGLTLHATAAGKATASLTLTGYTMADMSNGRISVSFGTDAAAGTTYMYVHANS